MHVRGCGRPSGSCFAVAGPVPVVYLTGDAGGELLQRAAASNPFGYVMIDLSALSSISGFSDLAITRTGTTP